MCVVRFKLSNNVVEMSNKSRLKKLRSCGKYTKKNFLKDAKIEND